MNKKQKIKQVIGIDEFDQYVTLNNIVDAGGNTVVLLKKIVESLHYDRYHQIVKFPTLLVTGQAQGKTTLSKAFLNTLCLEIKEIDASLFQAYNHIIEFFYGAHPECAYLITNVDKLPAVFHKVLFEIVRKHEYSLLNQVNTSEMRYPVDSIIVMTSSCTKDISSAILQHIHYIVHHIEHDSNRKALIVAQRLLNAQIKYSEECIKSIVAGTRSLKSTVDLLRICLDVVKADYRDFLTIDDVNKAIKLGS